MSFMRVGAEPQVRRCSLREGTFVGLSFPPPRPPLPLSSSEHIYARRVAKKRLPQLAWHVNK